MEVSIGFVITKTTIPDFKTLFVQCSELCDVVALMPVVSHSDKLSDMILSKGDFENILRQVREINAQGDLAKNGLKVDLDGFIANLWFTVFSDPTSFSKEWFQENPCTKTSNFCVVHPNGDITICCPSSLSLGNLNDSSFSEIWFSKESNEIRWRCLDVKQHNVPLPKTACFKCGHFPGEWTKRKFREQRIYSVS